MTDSDALAFELSCVEKDGAQHPRVMSSIVCGRLSDGRPAEIQEQTDVVRKGSHVRLALLLVWSIISASTPSQDAFVMSSPTILVNSHAIVLDQNKRVAARIIW